MQSLRSKMLNVSGHSLIMVGAMFCLLVISGCDLAQNQTRLDREANMDIQDYRDGFASRVEEDVDVQKKSEADIPSMQPYISMASEKAKSMPIVSLSVNQSVPLKDIFYELAEQADYDIELDPNIVGSIIFTARNRPLDEVVRRISNTAGLRYSFEGDVMRVELDKPYNKIYKVSYLNYVRTSSGSIRNDVNVVSGDGADTGSSFETGTESEIDFWGELEVSLNQIVSGVKVNGLRTSEDPQVSVAVSETEETDGTGDGAEDASVDIQTLLVSSAGGSGEVEEIEQGFSINKQAGIISVFGTQKTHERVKEYLEVVKRSVTAQVLIEAKVLEVRLNDSYSTGVDWNAVDVLFEGDLSLDTTLATQGDGNFSASFIGNDVTALIQALSTFGTVRALASPRLTVLNNQSAVMNVADNIVFFDVDLDVSTDDDTGDRDVDIDADIRNVPEGILVNVQPSIDLEARTISMAIRPTITRTIGEGKANPAIEFIAATENVDIESIVPELNVQEIDSVIRVNSGEPIVMGGLLQDRVTSTQNGVPVLSEVPLFGAAFKSYNDTIEKVELVIFMKATILDSPSDSVHPTDRDFYRKFSSDRRPFRF